MVTAGNKHEIAIRHEAEIDFGCISDVHLKAFRKPDEAALVKRLRQLSLFAPQMSIVAELENRIVGHILFSEITVANPQKSLRALALAPVAVLPRFQGKGIGSLLIKAGIKEMARLGFDVVLVLGEPAYYSRFGFKLEAGARVESTYSGANFMALELRADALEQGCHWKAIYSPPFEGL